LLYFALWSGVIWRRKEDEEVLINIVLSQFPKSNIIISIAIVKVRWGERVSERAIISKIAKCGKMFPDSRERRRRREANQSDVLLFLQKKAIELIRNKSKANNAACKFTG
jgi:hypothetical protein